MLYRVRLDYMDFTFDDRDDAMDFAEAAMKRKNADPDDRDFSVEIKLIKED